MSKSSKETPAPVASVPRTCGIVMPISSCDGCSEQHWIDVKQIVSDSIREAGFTPLLVSEASDVGVIQKRIVQNLYDNPIVVCDVSARNPNVMFELGMRLAFDKPTIIIKDDKTICPFDVSQIEHLEYPRDLRFFRIMAFKSSLKEKIESTVTRSESDRGYTTFLKHFGKFSVATLETTEVSRDEFIIAAINDLRNDISRLDIAQREVMRNREYRGKSQLHFDLSTQGQREVYKSQIQNYADRIYSMNSTDSKPMTDSDLYGALLDRFGSDSTMSRLFPTQEAMEHVLRNAVTNATVPF